MTKFLNISTDRTLGGSTPSDSTVSSQKAIKNYIADNVPMNTATGTDGVSLFGTSASGNYATNIGYSSSSGTEGVALGYSASAKTTSVSVGSRSGNDSNKINFVCVGYQATVGESYAVAIGYTSLANSQYGIAIGDTAYVLANSTGSIAIGYSTSIESQNAVAIGYDASVSGYGYGAVAIGYSASATGVGSIQLGHGTNTENQSLYVGFGAANEQYAVNYKLLGSTGLIPIERLGGDNTSTADKFLKENGSWSTIPGGWTPPSQTGNAGKFLTTDGTDTSWGEALTNKATGNASFSINSSTGNYVYAITPQTTFSSEYLTMFGYNASGNNKYSTCIGASAVSGGQGATCIGYDTRAAQNGVSLGRGAGGSSGNQSNYSICIGNSSMCRGESSVAVGYGSAGGSLSSNTYCTGIGAYAKANAAKSIQIGYGTNSEASTMYVGSQGGTNYKLLDLSTGNIPIARLGATSSDTGKFLKGDGTWADVGGGVATDGKSITTNSSDEIQTVGVIDQNNTSNAIKTWTGTKAQYDGITTKDANTVYNITDDANPLQALLETIYPVGSIYIGIMNICPLAALFGTWEKVSSGRVLQGSDTSHQAGTTIEAGLPNITGGFDTGDRRTHIINTSGAIYNTTVSSNLWASQSSVGGNTQGVGFDASLSNPIYGNSNTVQSPAFVVNIWQRTA